MKSHGRRLNLSVSGQQIVMRLQGQTALLTILLGALVLNAGLLFIAFAVQTNSHPEQLDQLISELQLTDAAPSKEYVADRIMSFQKYAQASDKLLHSFQLLSALIAAGNVLLVAGVTAAAYFLPKKPSVQ